MKFAVVEFAHGIFTVDDRGDFQLGVAKQLEAFMVQQQAIFRVLLGLKDAITRGRHLLCCCICGEDCGIESVMLIGWSDMES